MTLYYPSGSGPSGVGLYACAGVACTALTILIMYVIVTCWRRIPPPPTGEDRARPS